MNIAATNTVGEVASKVPQATRIFEKYGIDYCCGGGKSVSEACKSAGVEVDNVLRAIQLDAERVSESTGDYDSLTLRALMKHVVDTHHFFTREELVRLDVLIQKVVSVHGTRHPELTRVQTTFLRLFDDLMPHMIKEENVLFPYIERLEAAADTGRAVGPPPFVTVQNPVRMMMFEHETAGELLRELRDLTSGYTAPSDGCASYATLYAAMANFEKDLHQHIHLENNILFPRAIEMERTLMKARERKVL